MKMCGDCCKPVDPYNLNTLCDDCRPERSRQLFEQYEKTTLLVWQIIIGTSLLSIFAIALAVYEGSF